MPPIRCLLQKVCDHGKLHNLQHWILQKFNIALKAGFLKDSLEFTNSANITWAHAWYENTSSWGLGMHNFHIHPTLQHRTSTKNKI
jgi:hypothetical protein